MREIVVPHDPARGPVTAVRRMLVHSSIAELEQLGLVERYAGLIGSATLAQIKELIGPGWMPLELAMRHYDACDELGLPDQQIHDAGLRAGEKMGSSLQVAGAQGRATLIDGSPWAVVGAFSRMGRRIYEGGTSQYVKLGPNLLQIEH